LLGLKLPTDPRWADLAAISLEEILSDHAYCEQKAASQCISLIQKFPERVTLVKKLSEVVTEEWGHFRMVLAEIERRGFQLGRQRPDAYVNGLSALVPKGGSRELQLMDKLLLCALIEARSCERFKLLGEKLEEDYLRRFYKKFMVSEAGHYRLFLQLAREYLPADSVSKRWQFWLHSEATLIAALSPRGDRMH
jgi:tRNA-(ms[2]io[6]A)-hydroxylase